MSELDILLIGSKSIVVTDSGIRTVQNCNLKNYDYASTLMEDSYPEDTLVKIIQHLDNGDYVRGSIVKKKYVKPEKIPQGWKETSVPGIVKIKASYRQRELDSEASKTDVVIHYTDKSVTVTAIGSYPRRVVLSLGCY